jgi:hypothetical protein
MPTSARRPLACQASAIGELVVAELHAGELVRLLRVLARQAHRGVEVVGAGQESSFEDAHHEPRVDYVEHVGDLVLATCLGDRLGVGGIDLDGAEPVVADPSTSAWARSPS